MLGEAGKENLYVGGSFLSGGGGVAGVSGFLCSGVFGRWMIAGKCGAHAYVHAKHDEAREYGGVYGRSFHC